MSALPPKADVAGWQLDVREGPRADIAPNVRIHFRRHYDGDDMRHRSADFDDEWRDKLVEFHALADALTKQHPKRIFLSRKIPFELLALISCNYWKWPPTGHQSKQINLATESPH
jgi:hypothetical protein